MTTAICEHIDDFRCVRVVCVAAITLIGIYQCFISTRLVSYHVLNIEDKVTVARLLKAIDTSIGYRCVAWAVGARFVGCLCRCCLN